MNDHAASPGGPARVIVDRSLDACLSTAIEHYAEAAARGRWDLAERWGIAAETIVAQMKVPPARR